MARMYVPYLSQTHKHVLRYIFFGCLSIPPITGIHSAKKMHTTHRADTEQKEGTQKKNSRGKAFRVISTTFVVTLHHLSHSHPQRPHILTRPAPLPLWRSRKERLAIGNDRSCGTKRCSSLSVNGLTTKSCKTRVSPAHTYPNIKYFTLLLDRDRLVEKSLRVRRRRGQES
ncbi:unnamed protein product, partial [Ectocarpus sp. 12 AP-2014]